MIECILSDLSKSDKEDKSDKDPWHLISLRYFNPCGSHLSGLLQENPKQIATNLMPIMIRSCKTQSQIEVYGSDYPTADGTCIRDYIHVVDLAKGHIAALKKLDMYNYEVFNLGTGIGYSVLEMIKCFESVNNIKLNYKLGPRRVGDVAKLVADSSKAKNLLGWSTKKTLKDMCVDSFPKN
jgi:UDP-glucose 4-epimerase